MIDCEVSIVQMKFLDISMMIEYRIVTKGQLYLKLWDLELGVVDQIAEKEASNWRLLTTFDFF